MSPEQRHRTVVVAEADQEVAVHVGNTADGRWFRIWSSLVDHGVIKKLSLAECRTLIVMAKFAKRGKRGPASPPSHNKRG